jgi:hypothetical protein
MAAEKRRKPASRMTGDEIAKHVFPPEVHRHLKRAANPEDARKARQKPRSSKGRDPS